MAIPTYPKKDEIFFEVCPVHSDDSYLSVSTSWIQNKFLSPKAKGVLLYLLSFPEDTKMNIGELAVRQGIGNAYLHSAMDEIVQYGYAIRTRQKYDDDGYTKHIHFPQKSYWFNIKAENILKEN